VTKEIPAEADPTGENARWNALLDALRAIADDPTETPARRAKARGAWEKAVSGSGPAAAILVTPPVSARHTRGGGQFLRTRSEEEGGGKP